MKTSRSRGALRYTVVLLALLSGLGGACAAIAEQVYLEHERYGTWEMSLQYGRVGSALIEEVADTALDAESGSGWGASVGYNVNNHLLISMQFIGAGQDYRATLTTDDGSRAIDHELDLTSTLINGTWHIRSDGITPFITVGAGWTNVDSNIPSQETRSECWWDPWWGYSCESYHTTVNDNKTSLNAAVGVRWDFHTQGFARISYGKLWLDGGSSSGASPTVARLEIGIRR